MYPNPNWEIIGEQRRKDDMADAQQYRLIKQASARRVPSFRLRWDFQVFSRLKFMLAGWECQIRGIFATTPWLGQRSQPCAK